MQVKKKCITELHLCPNHSSKAQWSLYVPPDLTFTNSTFCQHTVFMCFVWISEQTAIISLYYINWLVFITETVCVYCAVRTECLYIILNIQPSKAQWSPYAPPDLTFTTSTFCQHTVFMCFVWISEQTAIISLYYINWLVFITETECVYCTVQTEYLNLIWVNLDEEDCSILIHVRCPVETVLSCFPS
jgi:hypothetical protein